MKSIPQFELSVAADVFNLAGQSADDPWRLDRERWQAAQDAEAAREFEARMQRTLAECPGFIGSDAPQSVGSKGKVVIEPGRVPEAMLWLKRRFHVAESLELSDGDGLVVEILPRQPRKLVNGRRIKVSFAPVEQFKLALW